MKVLQVNCVYKKGSTGKIVHDIHTELIKNGDESIICYGRGERIDEKGVYKTSTEVLAKFNNLKSRFTGLQYNGSFLATQKLFNIIKKENPDVVHLHCINGYFVNIYSLLDYLKNRNIKTILTLHAEFMYTANCGHAYECDKWISGCDNCPRLKEATKSYLLDRTSTSWNKMKKCFLNFDNLIVVPVSPWVEKRAKKSEFFKGIRIKTILNGIDTKSVFYPRNIESLKKKHNIKDEKVLLHVTASFQDPRKGGQFIIELAEKFKEDKIKIFVIGNKNRELKLPENIVDIGVIKNQEELATYYSLADLTILTSERETFSMVCAESLSCATPVVGFKAGAPEQISLKDYSEFVEYGNIELLQKSILKWINKKSERTRILEKNIKDVYSSKKMGLEYILCYKELLNNDHLL